jgi:hypothetical protein
MTALSSTDIWAAEEYGSSTNGGSLMAHFDGAGWTVRLSPDLGPSQWALSGLAPVATNDIWAVGFSAGSTLAQGLIEHYDGTSWTVVPGPRPNGVTSMLASIARIPHSNELWAVGQLSTTTRTNTLVEHYDGSRWTVVPSPNLGSYSNLLSVSADAPDDVWAGGEYYDGKARQTLIEHYDGRRWSVVPSPNVGSGGNWLNGVVALSRSDAWAVGEFLPSAGMPIALIEHYDGRSWTVATSPSLGSSSLFGLAASSLRDVWAVGAYQDPGAVYAHTLVEHFDGSSWTLVPTPDIDRANAVFISVTLIPHSNELWAVGSSNDTVGNRGGTFIRPVIRSLTWKC